MRTLGRCCSLFIFLLLPAPGDAGSFSATHTARVNTGLAFEVTTGITSRTSAETSWFYDLEGGCPLCNSSTIPIVEGGVTFGDRRVHLGLFGGWPGPQVEVYGQLHEGGRMDLGVGARAGIPLGGWSAHQLFVRSDYQLRKNLTLVVDPGLYYHTGKSPNGWNRGSALFFTQGIGLAISTSRVTFTPSIALVTGGGDLKLSGGPGPRHFNDTFGTVSVAVTFHRRRTD